MSKIMIVIVCTLCVLVLLVPCVSLAPIPFAKEIEEDTAVWSRCEFNKEECIDRLFLNLYRAVRDDHFDLADRIYAMIGKVSREALPDRSSDDRYYDGDDLVKRGRHYVGK